MSSELPVSDNPFEVLGLPRDVGDKELKKRYFQLLRQFPPESHPEEFSRLQRAYEQLQDPAARAALNEAEPYENVAEPWRTRLRDALKQLQEGQVDLGRVALKTLLEENGALTDARNLLQQVFVNEQAWTEAEKQLELLIEQEPANAYFRSRLTLVLMRQKRHVDVIASAEKWIALTEGRDTGAWEFLVEALAEDSRLNEAHVRLDEAMGKAEFVPPLHIARLYLHLRKPQVELIREDLNRFAASLKSDTPENRNIAAQRLQGVAASFFDGNHADAANLILETARALNGKEGAGVRFPHRVELFTEELPDSSREWLAAEAKDVHIVRVHGRSRKWDVVSSLLVTPIVAALLAMLLFFGQSERLLAESLFYGVVTLGVLWVAVWCWRQLVYSYSIDYRRMWSVHPLYLLQVGVEKVTAWPLVNFRDVQLTNHHTNGVYQSTMVSLQFGYERVKVSVRGEQLAVDFAQAIQQGRYRALQLLSGAMLEAEAGYDFIPLPLLEEGAPRPVVRTKRRALWMRLGAVAAASLVLSGGGAWLAGRRAEEKAWLAVVNRRPSALPAEQAPNGEGETQRRAHAAVKLGALQTAVAEVFAADKRTLEPSQRLLGAVSAAKEPGLVLSLQLRPSAEANSELLKSGGVKSEADFRAAFAAALDAAATDALPLLAAPREGVTELKVALAWSALPRKVRVGERSWEVLALEARASLQGQPLAQVSASLDPAELSLLATEAKADAVATAQMQLLTRKAAGQLARALGLSLASLTSLRAER